MATGRIAVVGAGIAGLTAGYFLKLAGHEPVILEASDKVGGRMTSDSAGGVTIDTGAQFLSKRYPVLSDLIARLRLAPDVTEIRGLKGTVRDGRLRKYAVNTALTPLKTGLLRPAGWLRYAWGGLRLRGEIRGLPLNDLAAWTEFDDVDAETWSNRYFGREVTRYLTEPPLGGLYFQALSQNSRAVPLFTGGLFYSQSPGSPFCPGASPRTSKSASTARSTHWSSRKRAWNWKWAASECVSIA
jgi:oxygen-dependent protoporphyrinogen oxidase